MYNANYISIRLPNNFLKKKKEPLKKMRKGNISAMQVTWVQHLGREDPLGEEMASHSNLLDWRMPMDRGAW